MAWQIKQKPEDFIVREIITDKTEAKWRDKISMLHGKPAAGSRGEYIWFTMTKIDTDFFKAIGMIANKLQISTKSISYSGTKDRRALTSQTVSVLGVEKEEIMKLGVPGIELSDFRRRRRHVKLGEHRGNRFRITVRNVRKGELGAIRESVDRVRKDGFLNLFGEQRFGSVRKSNHIIGKRILLGRPVASMKGMPLRKQKLFVHAYQALIWNRTAKQFARVKGAEGIPREMQIPLVGYGTNLAKYPAVRGTISRILESEGVSLSDFRIRDMPRLSSSGSARDVMAFPTGLSCDFSPDEMNWGMMKMLLSFSLGKGSYGTELVRKIQLYARTAFDKPR